MVTCVRTGIFTKVEWFTLGPERSGSGSGVASLTSAICPTERRERELQFCACEVVTVT